MPQEYIEYKSETAPRKITVVDGQPYYQSTGRNSSMPGVWLPFLLLVGTKHLNFSATPSWYNSKKLSSSITKRRRSLDGGCLQDYAQHMIKVYTSHIEMDKFRLSDQTGDERRPLKSMLVTSLRLGGCEQDEQSGFALSLLDEAEMKRVNEPIVLASESVFRSGNSDKINLWLISQGAEFAIGLLLTPMQQEKAPPSTTALLMQSVICVEPGTTHSANKLPEPVQTLKTSIPAVAFDNDEEWPMPRFHDEKKPKGPALKSTQYNHCLPFRCF